MSKVIEHKFNGFSYKMFLDKIESGNLKELYSIESERHPETPKRLYKYYSLNTNGVNAFIRSQLFASHPFHFNDPFDCNKELIDFSKTSLSDILELNRGIYDPKQIEEFYNSDKPVDKIVLYDILGKIVFGALYMNLGVYSMTANPESMEMWSYYGSHRGFCLKMNLEALPDSYIGPFPINYTDKFEAIDYSKMKLSSFLYQSNVKAKCWKDEHEWRLIFYANKALKVPCFDMPGSRNRVFYYDSKVVEKIILGFSFFDQCEFDTMRSTRDTFYVKLKNDRKLKQRLLKYILSRKIPVSIINSKNGTTSELVDRPVEIEKESNRKYKIKYVG